MGMKRVLSIGERLQKLLADAEAEAKAKITEAQSAADVKITAAQKEVQRER